MPPIGNYRCDVCKQDFAHCTISGPLPDTIRCPNHDSLVAIQNCPGRAVRFDPPLPDPRVCDWHGRVVEPSIKLSFKALSNPNRWPVIACDRRDMHLGHDHEMTARHVTSHLWCPGRPDQERPMRPASLSYAKARLSRASAKYRFLAGQHAALHAAHKIALKRAATMEATIRERDERIADLERGSWRLGKDDDAKVVQRSWRGVAKPFKRRGYTAEKHVQKMLFGAVPEGLLHWMMSRHDLNKGVTVREQYRHFTSDHPDLAADVSIVVRVGPQTAPWMTALSATPDS